MKSGSGFWIKAKVGCNVCFMPFAKCINGALSRVRKETGSQVLGSWNKEARANSSLCRVNEAVAASSSDWVVRAQVLLPFLYSWVYVKGSVFLGMCLNWSLWRSVFRCDWPFGSLTAMSPGLRFPQRLPRALTLSWIHASYITFRFFQP